MDFHILGPLLSDTDDLDTDHPDAAISPGASSSITYAFGTGVGPTTSWTSLADLDLSSDGVPDAVRLDFDGDGAADDAMWDSDGDGRADLAVIDSDDDGTPDAHYSDTGRGLWDHRVTDVHAGPADAVVPHAPTQGSPETTEAAPPDESRNRGRLADLDADGTTDDRVVDVDDTGRAQVGLVFAGAADPIPARLLIDLDGDGAFDAVLIDDDADGTADIFAARGQDRFDDGVARD